MCGSKDPLPIISLMTFVCVLWAVIGVFLCFSDDWLALVGIGCDLSASWGLKLPSGILYDAAVQSGFIRNPLFYFLRNSPQ